VWIPLRAADVVRVYLPADANTLLSAMDLDDRWQCRDYTRERGESHRRITWWQWPPEPETAP
jgi:hypothetical protein